MMCTSIMEASLQLIVETNSNNNTVMKKFITMLALVFCAVSINAQILRTEELEEYAKEKYGEKWVDAAENLGSQLKLDKNNALTFVQVIDAPGKTKDQLYVLLNYWFSATFKDANSVIQLNDKDLGSIIAQGYMEGIAAHAGGMNSYVVNIKPVIKCDLKDNKIRVTYTVPFYSVVRYVGGGWVGAMGGTAPTRSDENWVLDECFPFTTEKDSHKKTSSKALVMSYAYSNVVMDKIEECIKNGLVGNEAVHLRPKGDDLQHDGDHHLKEIVFVVRVGGVFLVQISQHIGQVDPLADERLVVTSVWIHQRHDQMHRVDVSELCAVFPVSEFFCHKYTLFLKSLGQKTFSCSRDILYDFAP